LLFDFFLPPDEFRRAVDEERFVEWEEVYAGTCYGTLRSELRIPAGESVGATRARWSSCPNRSEPKR